jgi:hypothetical protein
MYKEKKDMYFLRNLAFEPIFLLQWFIELIKPLYIVKKINFPKIIDIASQTILL